MRRQTAQQKMLNERNKRGKTQVAARSKLNLNWESFAWKLLYQKQFVGLVLVVPPLQCDICSAALLISTCSASCYHSSYLSPGTRSEQTRTHRENKWNQSGLHRGQEPILSYRLLTATALDVHCDPCVSVCDDEMCYLCFDLSISLLFVQQQSQRGLQILTFNYLENGRFFYSEDGMRLVLL